jgi:prepilin-type N-terminal cleavage/methylation domain-containing protein
LRSSRRETKKDKVMKIKTSRKAGFTLVEIMIVVAIIGLLAAIAIPNFVRARQTAQTNACLNNLRIIDAAKNQYALEKGLANGDATATAITLQPYLGHSATSVFPTCPVGAAAYTIGAIGTNPTCPNATAVGGTHYAVLN